MHALAIENSDFNVPMLVIGIIFALMAFFFVKFIIDTRKDRRKALEELEKPIEEAPITEIDASVLKKECFVKTYGVKTPETRKEFYITFSSFSGEYKRYSVSEELYLSVDEGAAGTIALVDDKFFDFYFED